MKKIIIYIIILIILVGCTCKKKKREKVKELSLKKIPDVIYPPEKTQIKEGISIISTESGKSILAYKENVSKETIVNPEINISTDQKTKSISLAEKERENEKKQNFYLSKNFSSWIGECLVYKAKWNFVNAGKGLILCKEEKNGYGNVYHFAGITIPEGTFAKLGYGYNRVDSFVDKKTLKPYYFYSYVRNGRKERITEIFFNFDKDEYIWRIKKFKDGTIYSKKSGKVKFKGNLYDGMYVFYVLRTANYEKNRTFDFPVAMVNIWDLIIKVKGKKKKIVPFIGSKEIYIIEPIAKCDEGIFRKGKMNVWLTADKDRIPVYFEGKVPFGTAKLSLISKIKIDSKSELNRELIYSILNSVE
ncbi:MAG: hypothetical protein B6D56_08485 [Candidatus Omnitrophica bacterium 4484_70.1]|nr:MAG: hypothetical protein B6D56_08485 [Candidatus Omnitrophica bacterium 4484_70.1]